MDFDLLVQLLQRGAVLEAIAGVWLSPLGALMIPLIWFALMVPVYVKTRSVFVVSALTMLFSALVMTMMPPDFHRVAYVLIALAFAAVLTRVFVRW